MKRFAAGLVLAALAAAPAFAQKTVTFAYQDMIVPLRTVTSCRSATRTPAPEPAP